MKVAAIKEGMKVRIRCGYDGKGRADGVVKKVKVGQDGGRFKHTVEHGEITYPSHTGGWMPYYMRNNSDPGTADIWSQRILCELDDKGNPLWDDKQKEKQAKQMKVAVEKELQKVQAEEAHDRLLFQLKALGINMENYWGKKKIVISGDESKIILADIIGKAFAEQFDAIVGTEQ